MLVLKEHMYNFKSKEQKNKQIMLWILKFCLTLNKTILSKNLFKFLENVGLKTLIREAKNHYVK